jgi:glycosyltransferase involved in cell wall biosynthesis
MTPILWRSILCSWSGWGRAAWKLAEAVERQGQRVAFDTSIGADETYGSVPQFILDRRARAGRYALCVQCSSPKVEPPAGVPTVNFTMWESTGCHPAWVEVINRCSALVVPSAFNVATFTAAGVRCPVHVCPLGIDPTIHNLQARHPAREKFTVGMAGRWHLGGTRKGHVEGMRAFRAAFEGRDDVALEVKCWPDDPAPDFGDSRIKIVRQPMTDAELAAWYGSLDLYLDPSMGEGWGMQTHEAMACGATVATTLWSGRTEYCHFRNVIPLEYDLAPGPEPYASLGVMARPRMDSMVRALRGAAERRDGLRSFGEQAAREVSRLTWDNAAARLLAILEKAA